jgi:hypothetical protein
VVDGVPGETFLVNGNRQSHVVASGLDPSQHHSIVLWKLSEDLDQNGAKGTATFHGFTLDSGAELAALPRRTRRLEFIGDSDTAGWCADGSPYSGFLTPERKENAHVRKENAHETWAAQLAEQLKSEMLVEAISGWGVGAGATAIDSHLRRTINFDSSAAAWDFTSWVPDAVVMLIDPNDESKLAGPALGVVEQPESARAVSDQATARPQTPRGEHFVKKYVQLLTLVATVYADAPTKPAIISVCGGSINGLDPCDDILSAHAQFNQTQSAFAASFVTITHAHWHQINTASGHGKYNGCESHYNAAGHHVLMHDIAPQVKAVLGWA